MGNSLQFRHCLVWTFLFLAPGLIVFESCSTSNNVVSHRLIQKRKYTKGWHFNSAQRQQKTSGHAVEEKYRAENEIHDSKNDSIAEAIRLEADTARLNPIKDVYSKLIVQILDSSNMLSAFVEKKTDKLHRIMRGRSNWIKGNSKYIPAPVTPMTVDEKGQLFAFIALMVSLLLIAGFLMHLIGPWTIADAGLVIMWILLLMSAAIAVAKNEQGVDTSNMRGLFRVSNVFMHWFFRVFFVLIIVAACLIILGLIIAFIIYLMGIANLIISTFGLVIGIIVTVLLVVSGVLYFLEIYPELFWVAVGALLLGVVFYSLYLAAPMYLVLLVLGYIFLIAGAALAIVHIVLSIMELG